MKIVCFGNSLTACGGENGRFSDILQDRFPAHEFINKGAGGESFVEAKVRLGADVLALKPDVVLLEYGANDWWQDERPCEEWAADLEQIIKQLQDNGAKVLVLGVFGPFRDEHGEEIEKEYGFDDRARAYRDLEAKIAKKHGCPYINNIQENIVGRRTCWSNRNHPNELGNRHVADTLEGILAELLGTEPQPVRKPVIHTTGDMWAEAVALAPDHIAVIEGEHRLTYAEADTQVRRLAAGMVRAGGVDKPKVAVFLPNCLEYFLIYWAVVRLGGVIVPLNTWLKLENLESVFQNVQPDVLFVNSAADKEVLSAAKTQGIKAILALKASDGLPALAELFESKGKAPLPELAETDLAIIMHTSGTTAAPKGAMMRHCDLVFNVMTTINAHQFRPSDVHLVVNPMFHCTALYSSLPAAACQKSTCVITAETSPERLMKLVDKERITTFLSIPTIFQRIVSLPDPTEYDSSQLRLLAYAGSTMPVSTIHRLQLYFPDVELHNFFGLTETISMTHVLGGDEADDRPDSIGRLLPFVEAIIVDEDQQQAPPGEVGELFFARENVIPGYYNDPDRLAQAICVIEGREWFRTGDLASVDEEGYFFIKGRAKDMIIVGGENVFATEIEAVLMAHDMVKEAAVKGIPATGVREVLGELIRAYVARLDRGLTEKDLRRHCHERLASFKIPHEIVFVDDLPRNPSGKVVKAELPD